MVTVRRPLYSGSGWPLTNGSGVALSYEVTVESLEQAIYDLLTEVRAVVGGPGSTLAQMLAGITPSGIAGIVTSVLQDVLFGGEPPSSVVATIDDLVPITDALATLADADPLSLPPTALNLGNLWSRLGDIQDTLAAGVPATELPDPAPSGYGGGASAEEVAAAVFATPFSTPTATGMVLGDFGDIVVEQAFATIVRAWREGIPDPRNQLFALMSATPSADYYGMMEYWANELLDPVPALDITQYQAGDTLLTFLNRELDGYTWDNVGPWDHSGDAAYALVPGVGGTFFWRCLLTEAQFQALARGGNPPASSGAPIWPGADNVTFGTGVPLAMGVVLDVPCDGIELNIVSSDRLIPYVGADTFKLYRSMGRVAFKSDDGYLESWQPVPADQCVMCPKTMSRAAGVVLSFYTGVTGLVTPWTVGT